MLPDLVGPNLESPWSIVGAYDDKPAWRADLIAILALFVAQNPDWPTLAGRYDAPAAAFGENLRRCGVGSGGLC